MALSNGRSLASRLRTKGMMALPFLFRALFAINEFRDLLLFCTIYVYNVLYLLHPENLSRAGARLLFSLKYLNTRMLLSFQLRRHLKYLQQFISHTRTSNHLGQLRYQAISSLWFCCIGFNIP